MAALVAAHTRETFGSDILTTRIMDPNNKLIKYLWYSSSRNDLLRLFSVLKFYGISPKLIFPTLLKYVKQNMTDVDIMLIFNNMIDGKKRLSGDLRERNIERGEDILYLLNESKQIPFTIDKDSQEAIGSYLDIGSSDGLITKTIGTVLKLPPKSIHAVDVKQWIGQENKIQATDIQFSYLDLRAKRILPYDDNSFELITILQALHHFENLHEMMLEIKRVCKPCGVVIIREHNADTKNLKALTDLEHLFYGILNDELPIENFAKDYYGEYRSSKEWDKLFLSYGLRPMYKMEKTNPTKYYYAVYIMT